MMQWPQNSCLIAFKNFNDFHRICVFLLTNVGKRSYIFEKLLLGHDRTNDLKNQFESEKYT